MSTSKLPVQVLALNRPPGDSLRLFGTLGVISEGIIIS